MTSNSTLSRVLPGLFIIGIGLVWMLRVAGVMIPDWLFSWEMLLIALGLFLGIKSGFKDWNFLLPLGVGVIFFINDFTDLRLGKFLIPALIILLGMYVIAKNLIKPKNNSGADGFGLSTEHTTTDGVVKIDAFLSGIKKSYDLPEFKGGTINNLLAGVDLNLKNTKVHGTAVLTVSTLLGGVKIWLPDDVQLISEIQAVMGDVDDKRFRASSNPTGTIILRGSAMLGGIEIRS
ncbi:membrane protein [Thermaurantimonas aggregans]|uniref:Membrane protein n=1 Tax=Thermaurantimonas aggregans TaxID=2173829 RepID=A0A401XL81_9FLAO|nr:hypothetical protein [Thermaurantimonas aggregans]MCX8148184.1 hypothetical protein [Thermaurantimonas aggregans]GCD77748.1 membrane protein [Thermaurantimonas aggregans]